MGRMAKIGPSVVIIGSNNITPESPHKRYYDLAVEIAEVLGREGWSCITGGGKGINEAAILGASLGGAKSVGIRLLSTEFKMNRRPTVRVKVSNPFNRKVLFDLFSDAYIFFPGGFGTLDALFEALTLQQTRKIDAKPIICVGKDFWEPLLKPLFDACLKPGFMTINPEDRKLAHITDNYRDIARIIWDYRGEVLQTKGKEGLPTARSASSMRAQGFANRVAMELVRAFNTFHGVGAGVTIFGSARTKPGGKVYDETVHLAQEVGKILTQRKHTLRGAIVTGGGPGNMEAANKGARLAGAPSLGLGIDLATEHGFNPYVDPDLSFEFKYFFTRKWLFSVLTDIFVTTPGGFGTFDELFEMLALRQRYLTMQPDLAAKAVYCVNRAFWEEPLGQLIDQLEQAGFVAREHRRLLHFNLDTEQAIPEIKRALTS